MGWTEYNYFKFRYIIFFPSYHIGILSHQDQKTPVPLSPEFDNIHYILQHIQIL
jgi:hypothetical protein